MTDIALTSLFGASATYNTGTGMVSFSLAEMHTIAKANNKHVLLFASDGTTPIVATVPDTFVAANYADPTDILGLIFATALSYTANNAKTVNGTLNNERNFAVSSFSNAYGTVSNFEPNKIHNYWQGTFTIYWQNTTALIYNPA